MRSTKQLILNLFLLGIIIIFPQSVHSQDQIKSNIDKIRELKEKVASKVSELREKQKVYVQGEVKSIKEDTFILITPDGDKTIQSDKNTNYYWINSTGKKLTISFKNIEKGDFFSVYGENSVDENILASQAVGKTDTFTLEGTVSEKSTTGKKFTLILDQKNTSFPTVLTSSTILYSITKGSLKDAAFSDITNGSRVFVRGSYTDSQKNIIDPKRIILLSHGKENITPTPSLRPLPTK